MHADKNGVLNPKRAIRSTSLIGNKASYFTDELFYNTHGNITAMTFCFKSNLGSFDGYVEIWRQCQITLRQPRVLVVTVRQSGNYIIVTKMF